jgi:hypothetical protein
MISSLPSSAIADTCRDEEGHVSDELSPMQCLKAIPAEASPLCFQGNEVVGLLTGHLKHVFT